MSTLVVRIYSCGLKPRWDAAITSQVRLDTQNLVSPIEARDFRNDANNRVNVWHSGQEFGLGLSSVGYVSNVGLKCLLKYIQYTLASVKMENKTIFWTDWFVDWLNGSRPTILAGQFAFYEPVKAILNWQYKTDILNINEKSESNTIIRCSF